MSTCTPYIIHDGEQTPRTRHSHVDLALLLQHLSRHLWIDTRSETYLDGDISVSNLFFLFFLDIQESTVAGRYNTVEPCCDHTSRFPRLIVTSDPSPAPLLINGQRSNHLPFHYRLKHSGKYYIGSYSSVTGEIKQRYPASANSGQFRTCGEVQESVSGDCNPSALTLPKSCRPRPSHRDRLTCSRVQSSSANHAT